MKLRAPSNLAEKLRVPHPDNEREPTFLISHDVQPIESGRRTWGWPAFISLWGTIAFNLNNFQIGSSLLVLGLNYWETFIATAIGHALGSAIVVLASFGGLEYHISFPVVTRTAWGYYGSIFVILFRILLSIIFFGINAWQGGLVTYVCLRAIWPSIDHIHNTIPASQGMTLPQFIGFIVFYAIQLPVLWLNPHRLRYLVYTGALGGFLVQLVMLCWACGTAKSFGSVLSGTSQLSGSKLGWMMVYGISITMSSFTSGTLSICDYARFSRKSSSGTWSQFLGGIPSWLSNIFGVLTIGATQARFQGSQLWSVASLLIAMQDGTPTSGTRAAVFFAGLFYGINQIAINVVGNSFSGGTDMSSIFPKYINIRRGQYITALLGLAINPWKLLTGANVFVSVISSFTVFLQPFIGILTAYYFVVFRRRVKVRDLYKVGRSNTIYWYDCGLNWRGLVAWICGSVPHVPGLLHAVNPNIKISTGGQKIYQLTSITSYVIAFVITTALATLFPERSQVEYIHGITRSEAMNECEEFIAEQFFDHESDGQSGIGGKSSAVHIEQSSWEKSL